MKIRLRWILPAFGLLLFFGETYASTQLNRQLKVRNHYRKYFYWGTFRLQTDPLNKVPSPPCPPSLANCSEWWDIGGVIIDPGFLLETQLISGLPAFLVGMKTVHGLGRLGVNEVYCFFFLTPILLFAWYFFVGWVLDRLLIRLKLRKSAAS